MRKHVFAILLLASLATASSKRLKHHHRSPKYEYHWKEVVQNCSFELNNYWMNNRTQCRAPCACVADCLLKNSSETIKADMGSVDIILGLTPSILALLGPSVTQLSLLSARFPLLALSLALASPAISLLHLLRGAESSEDELGAPTSMMVALWYDWLREKAPGTKMAFRIVEFVLVGAMLANNIHVSIELDLRSVSGVRCAQMFMPLMWSSAASLSICSA